MELKRKRKASRARRKQLFQNEWEKEKVSIRKSGTRASSASKIAQALALARDREREAGRDDARGCCLREEGQRKNEREKKIKSGLNEFFFSVESSLAPPELTDVDSRPLVVFVVLRPKHGEVAAEAQLKTRVARPNNLRRSGRGAAVCGQRVHSKRVKHSAGSSQIQNAVGDRDVAEAGLIFFFSRGREMQKTSVVAASFLCFLSLSLRPFSLSPLLGLTATAVGWLFESTMLKVYVLVDAYAGSWLTL